MVQLNLNCPFSFALTKGTIKLRIDGSIVVCTKYGRDGVKCVLEQFKREQEREKRMSDLLERENGEKEEFLN